MASLTLAPQGLLVNRSNLGAAPNYNQAVRYIKKSYATAIGFGDLVSTGTGGNLGYTIVGVTGLSNALGVFQGCEYYDTAQKQWIFSPYWNGTATTAGDIRAYICMDPNIIYTIQVSGGPATQADVGKNLDIVNASGVNTTTGLSQMAADYTTINTTTKILRIVAISNRFFPGYDPAITNPDNLSTFPTNNYVDVTLNLSEFANATGI